MNPTWPTEAELTVPLSQGQKERHRREEVYAVLFTDPDGEKHTYKPKSVQELRKFSKGRTCRLKVGLVHGVEVLP
jgi:hypothetical protein